MGDGKNQNVISLKIPNRDSIDQLWSAGEIFFLGGGGDGPLLEGPCI